MGSMGFSYQTFFLFFFEKQRKERKSISPGLDVKLHPGAFVALPPETL